MGVVPRHLHQCGAGSLAFRRHNTLWSGRSALRRHQPRRSRSSRIHGRCRYCRPAGLFRGVWAVRGTPLDSRGLEKVPAIEEQNAALLRLFQSGWAGSIDQAGSQQRDLFESERSFRLLVEAVTDYALYMLDPSGRVSSWNIGAQRIKGYEPAEILGQHFSRFYTEADRANGKPARALRTAEEHGRYEEEGWRVRKDGTFFWASVVIDPIRENGELVGFAKITRDITERREAQLKLEQMHQQLAESQKLDALGQLTGGVAHDFNNLLMIISGSLYTLRKAVGDDPKSQRALSAIEGATKRGASLTSQLLTFARRQSVNPQAVDVAERIDAVREVLDAAVGSAVTLQFDVEPGVWPVMVDVAEFETALVNLVINARDAMTGGGVIIISAHNDKRGGEVGAGNVAISVQDSGTGIAPDILSKIFDPFFTTKPIGKGTGLGLSQVHGFTHQAGGTVRVTSELGKGTRITILLPRQKGGG